MELHYLDHSPFQQFHDWFKEAEAKTGLSFPNAMSLATCSPEGLPSVRMVLLKGLTEEGFSFFTNYESRKGRELTANPHAALCFYWEKLERQVRVEGSVTKLSPAASQEYFDTRPRGSRLGAWASPQGQTIASREFLEKRLEETERRFHGQEQFPRPENWGGFLLKPARFEFWQQGAYRLHDRFVYEPAESGWSVKRLAP